MTTQAFGLWMTGLPSSGKSTITRALVGMLRDRGVHVAVLESDALRRALTPHPTYSDEERETFYQAMAHVGSLLVTHGVPVIFDATANRRRYRDAARQAIERFIEVYVECPLEICVARDPKGIYRRGQAGQASTVPGLQASYEPPERPDIVVSGAYQPPDEAARAIARELERRRYVAPEPIAAQP